MGRNLRAALVFSAGIVAGCASPEVVDVTRTSDLEMTCKELETSIADAEGFRQAAQEEKGATGTNVAAAIFFWPALLVTYNNIDEATEAAEERKTRLADLYENKGCAGGAVVAANGDGDAVKVDGGAVMATASDGADYYDGLRAYDAGHHAAAAVAWEVAAKANDAKAQYRLGEMHQSGQGVPQNFVKAHLYFNLAAAQGHAEAQAARDALAGQMTPSDISRAQKLAEDWRAIPAKPQVAAMSLATEAEPPACGPVARDVDSEPELRQALAAYYKKHPIQRNPWYGTAYPIESIEKLKVVKTRGNTLTIKVKYYARKAHSGTATVEACGSSYKVLSFT